MKLEIDTATGDILVNGKKDESVIVSRINREDDANASTLGGCPMRGYGLSNVIITIIGPWGWHEQADQLAKGDQP